MMSESEARKAHRARQDAKVVERARHELETMNRIVDALEPLDGEKWERVLAASAILVGVASIEAVRTVLYSVLGDHRGTR